MDEHISLGHLFQSCLDTESIALLTEKACLSNCAWRMALQPNSRQAGVKFPEKAKLAQEASLYLEGLDQSGRQGVNEADGV